MSVATDNFKTGVNSDITTKTAARSISAAIVGGKFADLADIVANIITGYDSDISTIEADLVTKQTAIDAINALIGPEAGDGDTAVNKLREALAILQNFSEGADVAGLINGKVDKVIGSSLLADTEIARLLTLSNYTHPTGDGNLHVPATSTTNNGKFLMAGATAGALSWSAVTLAISAVTGLTAALAAKADLVGGLIPLSQIPVLTADKIPDEDLYPFFNSQDHYEYDSGGGVWKIGLRTWSKSVKWLKDLGVSIKAETFFVEFGQAFGTTMASGQTRFTWVKLDEATTITEVITYLKTAGVYTASGSNNVGIYSYNIGTQVATLVADTGNVSTLWAAAGATRTPLTASYNAAAGWYLIATRYEASGTPTTNPIILAEQLDGTASVAFEGRKLCITTTASLPATIDVSAATVYSNPFWTGLN